MNPFYFFDKSLGIGFKINLETHNINHANSISTTTPIYSDFGLELRRINNFFKKTLLFRLE